ncbi:hypothetical protein GWI33_010203 [Rhynchophorus ferrugineus]|uniref:Uncharacterized protein n=1 Tax=Rhynchophorus ferrugineus TaxID=354439 RepID=A0A834IV92_RHYFE|nr:hypothetical protein GWI33_010203 [Rhynchophorus ferrugineus]
MSSEIWEKHCETHRERKEKNERGVVHCFIVAFSRKKASQRSDHDLRVKGISMFMEPNYTYRQLWERVSRKKNFITIPFPLNYQLSNTASRNNFFQVALSSCGQRQIAPAPHQSVAIPLTVQSSVGALLNTATPPVGDPRSSNTKTVDIKGTGLAFDTRANLNFNQRPVSRRLLRRLWFQPCLHSRSFWCVSDFRQQ